MSKRVANCRGRTTARFGRVNYGRFYRGSHPAPTPRESFIIDRPGFWRRQANKVKQFMRRHQSR